MLDNVSAAAPARSTAFDVIAIGSSAGGVTALGTLLAGLAADLPVPLLVVEHLDRRHKTVIADVLQRRSRLHVKLAEDGESAAPGIVYIAPPDRHLLVREGGVLTLTESELVHFVRPSADLLFESVAATYGDRAIACVLTGTGVDGSMGVTAVSDRGGTVIVEDPRTAEFNGMPEAAATTGAGDFVLPLDEIASVLDGLVRQRGA
ncbi:two-component system, chemotaxis family, response regulator CheB [Nocardioides sp. YR527]|uniref:chemotaxis protein CheB n=1 Tax=Nocardioides sp. YR527 TaxID=1881028 RepID=UPI0008915C45|nr:chemotaxis protein CheB [Nocardioides sp. YR527]SDK49870.1 two-component system, chemotaxis family, response regulator CheB [Nocardioides sp. YR527]